MQISRHLIDRGHEVIINTGAALEFLAEQVPNQLLHTRKILLDSGAFQQDAFTVDMQSASHRFKDFSRVQQELHA